MTDFDTAATLQEQVKALDSSFGAAATVAGAFDGELQRMRRALADTGRDMATLERGFSGGLRRAFDGVAFDGMKLSDALKTVATSMVNTTYQSALRPVTDHFGTLLSKGGGRACRRCPALRQGRQLRARPRHALCRRRHRHQPHHFPDARRHGPDG
jgi:hypothetical protein